MRMLPGRRQCLHKIAGGKACGCCANLLLTSVQAHKEQILPVKKATLVSRLGENTSTLTGADHIHDTWGDT